MKNHLFKKLSNVLFALFLILVSFTSCQNEETEITDTNTEQTFDNASELAQSILSTTTFDGSFDNILDSANCLSINLPVTVEVNGITITIESFDDYDELEDILDEFTDDDDDITIQFPITITLSNYEEVVINSEAELLGFVEDCFGENEIDDDIECIDFQYPITISIFNTSFDVIDTVTINDDEALYNFIDDLEGGVLASINYPITMVLYDGSTIQVNNNDELQAAINEADDACDEDDDYDYNDDDECSQDGIELTLMECSWYISHYNGDDVFDGYYLAFDPNYGFTVSTNGNVIHDGTWSVAEVDGNFTITFDTDWEDLAGDWTIDDCDDNDDEYDLVNGNITMQIEQECDDDNDPLGCFETEAIEKCDEDNDGVEVFNLYEGLYEIQDCELNNTISVSFHETLAGAEGDFDEILEATSYTNTTNPQTVYVRVELFDNPSEFEVLEIDLILEDCSSSCSESDVDQYLTTCVWNVVNYNGSDDLIIFDFEFNSDGTVSISGDGQTIEAMWSTSQSANGGVEVEFTNINMGNIQAISGNWLIIDCQEDRLEMVNNNNDSMVMEQQDDC